MDKVCGGLWKTDDALTPQDPTATRGIGMADVGTTFLEGIQTVRCKRVWCEFVDKTVKVRH